MAAPEYRRKGVVMRFAAALGRDLRQTVGFPRGLQGRHGQQMAGRPAVWGLRGRGFSDFDGSKPNSGKWVWIVRVAGVGQAWLGVAWELG